MPEGSAAYVETGGTLDADALDGELSARPGTDVEQRSNPAPPSSGDRATTSEPAPPTAPTDPTTDDAGNVTPSTALMPAATSPLSAPQPGSRLDRPQPTRTDPARSSASGASPTPAAITGISGPDLMAVDDPPPDSCLQPIPDEPCAAASPTTVTPTTLRGVVSMGEYQQQVAVPIGSRVDLYFDQSRDLDDMRRRCFNLHGSLMQRTDGSRWSGWWYCHDIEY